LLFPDRADASTQRLAQSIFDDLVEGSSGLRRLGLGVGQKMVIDLDRGTHASKHQGDASRCQACPGATSDLVHHSLDAAHVREVGAAELQRVAVLRHDGVAGSDDLEPAARKDAPKEPERQENLLTTE